MRRPERGKTDGYYRYASSMRVTSKGQVTIPLEIRRQLGIEPGAEVEFIATDDGVRLVKTSSGEGAAIVRQMRERARGKVTMTTDELMQLTRERT